MPLQASTQQSLLSTIANNLNIVPQKKQTIPQLPSDYMPQKVHLQYSQAQTAGNAL